MANLDLLSQFARFKNANFTGPLEHAKVVELADHWMPNIHFHEDEQFHPVDLDGLYRIPSEEFVVLPPLAQEEFRINVGGDPFGPALIRESDQVFGSGPNIYEALADPQVDDDAIYTHGKRLGAAKQFFGSTVTISGLPEPGPTNPRVPRHLPVTVRAECRMFLETLKHELDLDERTIPGVPNEPKRPLDGIWEGFNIIDLLIVEDKENNGGPGGQPIFTDKDKRDIVRAMVVAVVAQDEVAEKTEIGEIPTGWSLNEDAWQIVKLAGVLEFHLIYAYNDFSEYGNWLYTNEHEGDAEGLCLVFDRSTLQRYADNDPATPVEQASPFAMITLAHEMFHHTDTILPLDSDPADVRANLNAYVARGSHGTYTKVGSFDIYDFGANASVLFQGPTWLDILAGLLFPILFPLSLTLEHFAGVDDETSDDGITVSSEPPDPNSDPLTHLQAQIVSTPLSDINGSENIYGVDLGDDVMRRTLAVRAYNGKLGAHDDLVDKSSHWENKTYRYFSRLVHAVSSGRVRAPIEPL